MAQRHTASGRRPVLVWLAVVLILVLAIALAAVVFIIGPEQQLRQQVQATAEARQAEVERLYAAGVAFQNAGDWEAAEAEFKQVITLDTNYKDVQNRLADVREQQKAYHYQRGLDFMNTGQYAEAVEEFKIVMGLDTRYEDVQAKLNEAEAQKAEALALTPTATPIPTATPVPPTATPVPSPTATLISTPTPLPPTATPTPSPTPSPTTTSTPEPALLFFDDFDAGPKPDWEVLSGEWGMAGGKYTMIDISGGSVAGISLVGDPSWRDYAIEVDVTGLYSFYGDESYDNEAMNRKDLGMSRAAILVRAQDNGNCAGLIVGDGHIEWGTLIDGRWSVVSGTLVDGYGEKGTHLRIEARGHVYTTYVDGKMITSFSDTRFASGKVGLWLRSTDFLDASDWRAVPKIDNFKVTRLD